MSTNPLHVSDTIALRSQDEGALFTIMATAGPLTVLFIFTDPVTDPFLRQALDRKDLHLLVVPPGSP